MEILDKEKDVYFCNDSDVPECPKGPDGNYIFPTYTEDPPFDVPVDYPDTSDSDFEPDIRWNE